MLGVVLDTNVYVSALNFGGVPLEILVAAVRRKILLFTSPPILLEVEEVLVRKFSWSPQRAAHAIRLIQGIAKSVSPQEKLQIIKIDEPDNRILECARAANAKVIVSGDSHLRNLKRFGDVIIISPREFVETALL